MRRRFRSLLFFFAVGLLVVVVVRETDFIPSFKTFFQPKAIVVDKTPLVLQEIKNITQLLTVEAYNEVVVDTSRSLFGISPRIFRALPGNPLALLPSSQLVLVVRGKVVAGVDLKTFDSTHIQVRNDSLFIQLPPASILDVITNPSDVDVFIERGEWTEQAATLLKIKARNRLVQQALAQGALQQANSKARQLVFTFFKNAGYKEVFVTTAVDARPQSGKK